MKISNPYLWEGCFAIGDLTAVAKRDALAVGSTLPKGEQEARRVLRLLREAQDHWRSEQQGGRKANGGTPFCAAIDLIVFPPHLQKPLKIRKKRAADRSGFIYFIAFEDDQTIVKIGFATIVATRLSALQTSSHRVLKVLVAFPGTPVAEKKLHLQFAADRVRGEWFRLSPEIAEFIAAEKAKQLMGQATLLGNSHERSIGERGR